MPLTVPKRPPKGPQTTLKQPKVHYMLSSLWLLPVESCDFSQAEKERTACKSEQIHKMTTTFTQIVVILRVSSA